MAEQQTIFNSKILQVGDKVGPFLLLRKFSKDGGKRYYWNTRCSECGKERPIRTDHLKRYVGAACDCRNLIVFHGQSRVREFKIWKHMLARCYNVKNDNFRFYGGIGRYVCQRWRDSYGAFLADLGKAPSLEHSLDRIDSNGSYTCGKCDECRERDEPANARWATKDTQARNQVSNRRYTYNGETMILKDWARRVGIRYLTLHHRLELGWDFETAITKPVRPLKR